MALEKKKHSIPYFQEFALEKKGCAFAVVVVELDNFQCHCIVRTWGNIFTFPLGTVYLLAAGGSPGKMEDRICLGSTSPLDLGSLGYTFGRNTVVSRECQGQIFCACRWRPDPRALGPPHGQNADILFCKPHLSFRSAPASRPQVCGAGRATWYQMDFFRS